MNKHIYLLRGRGSEDYVSFRERILKLSSEASELPGISKLSVTITTEKPPVVSVIPFKKGKIAAVSLINENHSSERFFYNQPGFSGAYKVTEALPRSYVRDWPCGEVTPGVCLLTLFRRKKKITRDDYLHRWHNGHTPLTLKVHPVWHYNRNVVDEMLTDGSEGHEGIVEEHFLQSSHLLNPAKFFGNPLTMLPNMLRVYFDVNSFLDYKSTEPYLVREYHIKDTEG